jgi:ankyrin repeat protein
MFYVSQRENNINNLSYCDNKYDCQYELLTFPGLRLKITGIKRSKNDLDKIYATIENYNYIYGNNHLSLMKNFVINHDIDKNFSEIISYSRKFNDTNFLYKYIKRGRKTAVSFTINETSGNERDMNDEMIQPSCYYMASLYFNSINNNAMFDIEYPSSTSDIGQQIGGVMTENRYVHQYARNSTKYEFTLSFPRDDDDVYPLNYSRKRTSFDIHNYANNLGFITLLDTVEMTFMNEIYEYMIDNDLIKSPENVKLMKKNDFDIRYEVKNNSIFKIKGAFNDISNIKNTINNYNINDIYSTYDGNYGSVLHLFIDNKSGLNRNLGLYKYEKMDEILLYFLSLDNVDLNIRDVISRTPLHIAVQNSSLSVVVLLLEQDNIDINLKGIRGRSPIYSIVPVDHEKNMRDIYVLFDSLIADNRIDINLLDDNSFTIFDYILDIMYQSVHTASYLSFLLVKIIDMFIDNEDFIKHTIDNSLSKIFSLWTKEGITEKDKHIIALLETLTSYVKDKSISFVLESDIIEEIAAVSKKRNNNDVLKIAKKVSLDVDDMNMVDVYSSKDMRDDIQNVLIDIDKVKNRITSDNINDLYDFNDTKSPLLHIFISSKKIKITKSKRKTIFKHLININGINLEIKDRSGRTALHRAVMKPRVDELIMLLGKKVSVNTKDNRGNTPLYYNVVQYSKKFSSSRDEIFNSFINVHVSNIHDEDLDINAINQNGRNLLQNMVTKMADQSIIKKMSKNLIHFINIFGSDLNKKGWWHMLDTLLMIWSVSEDSDEIFHNSEDVYNCITKLIFSGGGIGNIDTDDISYETINQVKKIAGENNRHNMITLIDTIKEDKDEWEKSKSSIIISKSTGKRNAQFSGSLGFVLKPVIKKKKITTLIGSGLINEYCDNCSKSLDKINPGAITKINGVKFIVCSQNCSNIMFDELNKK